MKARHVCSERFWQRDSHNQHNVLEMLTSLLLLLTAFVCFAIFYKAIEWFEHI